jgi:hypothetical protein
MKEPMRQLTIDQAVAEFYAMLREGGLDAPAGGGGPAETPEAAEAGHFRVADRLILLACPDPTRCVDQRCRRDARCRHMAYLRDRERAGTSLHPRRTPGAEAMRYAIWVYMSSQPCGA